MDNTSNKEHVKQENTKNDGSKRQKIPWLLVISLILVILTYQLSLSMVNPALPNIANTLGVTVERVSAVSSYILLVASIAGIVIARWSDFIGRRTSLYIIVISMIVGSILCAIAPNFTVLVIGRMLQGAAGAGFQITFIVLKELLDSQTYGTVAGLVTAVNGGLIGLDAFLGGLLTDFFSFRAIFVFLLIMGTIALIGIKISVPELKGTSTGKMDWWGALLVSISLIFITLAVEEGNAVQWSSLTPRLLVLLAVGLISFIIFYQVEKRSKSPLFAVEYMKSRQIWPVVGITLFSLMGAFPVIQYLISIFAQDPNVGFGLSASMTGLMFFTPAAVIGLLSAPISGTLAGKIGWFPVLRIGIILAAASLLAFILFPGNLWVVVIAIGALGISYNGMILTVVNGLGVLQAPDDAPGALTGINGAAFGVGASLGIGLMSPLVGQGTVESYTSALWLGIGSLAVALALTLVADPKPETLPETTTNSKNATELG